MSESYTGCQHYKRKALLLAPCCSSNTFVACRFCHDKVHNEDEKDPKKAHTMDRHAVKIIKCMECNTEQPASQTCTNCHITLGAYWCPICVFLDDEDKGQYHCKECGICRIGGADVHTHCNKCGICVKTASLETHGCASNAAKVDCSVCLESLHSSRDPIQFLQCGHGLHAPCMESFLKSGQSSCPLCKKSILTGEMLQHTIRAMDIEIALTPMPEEYRKKRVRIRCNDCREESITPFHILRLKCRGTCGSYNTVKIGEAPDSEEKDLTIEEVIRDLFGSLGEE